MEDRNLRLMALSAPHWVKKAAQKSVTLNSRSPFSLQNAVRLAASKALNGEGSLGKSNWASRENLRDSVFLMEYWEDEKESLEQKLREIRPNVLFIGAMTLAFPGAIEVAKLAKEILGEEVFIVLGGKHTNETFFDSGSKLASNIQNTKGSPLRLMKEFKIDQVFDLVCSGPAEELIAAVTERIGELLEEGKEPKEIYGEIESLAKTVRGDWRAGWVNDGEVEQFQSLKLPIDYGEMPVPADIFGIKGKFDVFGTEITAHAFSDTSPGCVFDCFFCSERSSINPHTQDRNHAADRLFRQFKSIKEVAIRENHTDSVSVFVEDSTLLNIGRDPAQLHKLAELMKAEDFKINFGGQFTVDELLDPRIQEALVELKDVGFSYVFTGMETEDEAIAGRMAKNLDKGTENWVSRNEQVVAFLKETGIKYGVSVLFGLGEKQETRLKQLDQIKDWQTKYGEPVVVSLNLATIHPLQEGGLDEDFIEWGTKADSPRIEEFQRVFGEGSERYAVDKEHIPTVEELKELEQKYWELRLDQEVRGELNPNRQKGISLN